MYGNEKLPGFEGSEEYRYEGGIWCGSPASTWFKTVKVEGEVKKGMIIKENLNSSIYSVFEVEDIINMPANLPGVRLGIVADKEAKGASGSPVSVLIGIQGQVDKNKLLIGETAFSGLTDAQKINLNTQLEAWGFQLIDVKQR